MLRGRGGAHYDKPKSCSLESLAISRGIIESPTSKHPLAERLRAELAARGTDGYGFSDFQKRLNILDRDYTGTINLDQLKIVFQHCSLSFTDQEVSTLFYFFESCGKVYIDIDEFILGIRGPISFKRRELIERAFLQIDSVGEGLLSPEDIIDRFDPTHHPDVKSGSKKAQDVFRDFLRSFEVGGEVDGKITRHEFINYYSNVSAAIEHDDYFETMLRNAWHITSNNGGSGSIRIGGGNTVESLDFSPPRQTDSSFHRGGMGNGGGGFAQHSSSSSEEQHRFVYSDRDGPRGDGPRGQQQHQDNRIDRDRRPWSSGHSHNMNRHQKF